MANRRLNSLEPGGHTSGLLTFIEVINETVRLVRARRAYFLVLLPTFLLTLILRQGWSDYYNYMGYRSSLAFSNESKLSCRDNILKPWLIAALQKNFSASQQEEFYKLSQLNCSMFKTPAESSGTYEFKNGSLQVRLRHDDDLFDPVPHPVVHGNTWLVTLLVLSLWDIWAFVAVAWGLQVATTTATSYNTRPNEKVSLTDLIREQFSRNVLQGIFRVSLTNTLAWIFIIGTNFVFGALVRALVASVSVKLKQDIALWASSPAWTIANPLLLLFVLSTAAAALEPGMWGFKALWRGIQLMNGKPLNTFFIHVMLSLWQLLFKYLVKAITLEPAEWMNQSFWGVALRSMEMSSVNAASRLPGLFLVPVFYFFCKSCREKVATMA